MGAIILAIVATSIWNVSNNQDEGVHDTTSAQVAQDDLRRDLVEPKYIENNPPEQILRRFAYTTSYNEKTKNPNWVGWILTADHTDGEYARKGHSFMEDLEVPFPRSVYTDIREGDCGYQRGHMCPAGDNKWSYRAQNEAFFMTNICPQDGDLNQRDWKYLEEACREWARVYGRVFIVAGPIFRTNAYKTVGEHCVGVPDAFFKVILRLSDDHTTGEAIGFIYANSSGHREMECYSCSVDEVEEITGLDFFYQLDNEIENRIEANYDCKNW